MRALVVITFRPEFSAPKAWLDHAHVDYRAIEKLAPEHALGLAAWVAGDRLPKETIEQVVARTDGVPLFIEELTKAVLDIDVSGEQEDRYELRPTDALLAIPATLQDSLMARLDQLGPAKSIAQVAGAIGREFGYDLLEAVAQIGPARLREGLAALESSGLVYADSRLGLPSYAF